MKKRPLKQIRVAPARSMEEVLLDLSSAVSRPAPSGKVQPWITDKAAGIAMVMAGALNNRIRGARFFRPENAPDNHRAEVQRSAGAKLIARLLNLEEDFSEFLRMKAAQTLSTLSSDDPGREQVAESGGVAHLVEVASVYVSSCQPNLDMGTQVYDESRLVEVALGALRNVSGFKGSAAEMVGAGIVAPLLEAVHHATPLAKLLASSCLLGLMQNRHLLPMLRDHGAVVPFLQMVGENSRDPLFALIGAQGLCAMADETETCKNLPYMTGPSPSRVISSPGTSLSQTKLYFKERRSEGAKNQNQEKIKVPQILKERLALNHPEEFKFEHDLVPSDPPTGGPYDLVVDKTSEAIVLCLLKLLKLEQHRRQPWAKDFVQPLLHQLHVGTNKSRSAALLILCTLQVEDPGDEIALALSAPLIHMLETGTWDVKVSSAKTVLNIYHSKELKQELVDMGCAEVLVQILDEADAILQEHPLSALIHLVTLPESLLQNPRCSNSDVVERVTSTHGEKVPTRIVDAEGLPLLSKVVEESMGDTPTKKINRILALGILKACYIYCSRSPFFIEECPSWIIHDIKHHPEELREFIGELIAIRKSTDYFEIPPDRAAWFTPEELEQFKENFKTLDEDASGAIDAEELENLLRKLGEKPNRRKVLKLIEEVDEDESGEVEFNEFLYVMKLMQEGKPTGLGQLVQRAFIDSVIEAVKEAGESIWRYFHQEEYILKQMDLEEKAKREYLQQLHSFGEDYWRGVAEQHQQRAEQAYTESITAARRESVQLQRFR